MILDEIIFLIIVICAGCEVVSTILTMVYALVCPLLLKSVQLVRKNEHFNSYEYINVCCLILKLNHLCEYSPSKIIKAILDKNEAIGI